MLFLNAEFAFEKLFDTAEISMFWQFCSQSGSNFDHPVAIKSCEVSAKVACVCPCTQENLEFLATKSLFISIKCLAGRLFCRLFCLFYISDRGV